MLTNGDGGRRPARCPGPEALLGPLQASSKLHASHLCSSHLELGPFAADANVTSPGTGGWALLPDRTVSWRSPNPSARHGPCRQQVLCEITCCMTQGSPEKQSRGNIYINSFIHILYLYVYLYIYYLYIIYKYAYLYIIYYI